MRMGLDFGDQTLALLKTRCRKIGGGKKPIFPLIHGEFDPSKKSGVGVDFELLVRSLQVRNKGAAQKPSMILGELADKTKRVRKAHVSNIFFSKKNICASRRETIPLCK